MVKSVRDSSKQRQRLKNARLTLEQRNSKLKEASADYLKGEITEEELEKFEEDLATNYSEAAYDIASPARVLWLSVKQLFSSQRRR